MLYITGITGHSGRWLLKRLEAERYLGPIRVVMRKSKEDTPDAYKIFEDSKLDLHYTVGDLCDPTFLLESLSGVETIINIAGISYSTAIVNAAIQSNTSWCILVHTTGRFSKYKSASARYIEIEEDILKLRDKGNIKVTILRPTMIYGSSGDRNMYRLITYLAKHKFFPVFGSGENLMQPVHARDLGNAYYDVLNKPETTQGKEYDLSGKAPIQYIQILKTISYALNSRNTFIHIPMKLSLLAAKMYNYLFRKRSIISVEQVMRMNENKSFSHKLAQVDFGYDPLPFEEGIQDEVSEFLKGTRYDFSNITYQ